MSRPFEARTVVCPTCGVQARYAPDNPWRPFCSERCKQLDLGAWASERMRLPDPTPPNTDMANDQALRH